MRTCYIAIGRGLAQALWWEYCAKERKKNGLFHEDDRMIAVDWCTASEEKYKEENSDLYVYLVPRLTTEEETAGGLKNVLKGNRRISRMAYYAEKINTKFDHHFDTDELQLVFLVSSVGSFLLGEAPEIINFFISKIACTFPECKLRIRTIVYTNEIYKQFKVQQGETMYEQTKWFLNRYLAEEGKRKCLCAADEIYVIDKDCCAFEDLFHSIGFSENMLKKMDSMKMILAP